MLYSVAGERCPNERCYRKMDFKSYSGGLQFPIRGEAVAMSSRVLNFLIYGIAVGLGFPVLNDRYLDVGDGGICYVTLGRYLGGCVYAHCSV